jgi:4-hydroxy-tetrahydrodipicolinate reductase
MIEKNADLKAWKEDSAEDPSVVKVSSRREGEIPGTHSVIFSSEIDTITITHEAHSRKGFALPGLVCILEIGPTRGSHAWK